MAFVELRVLVLYSNRSLADNARLVLSRLFLHFLVILTLSHSLREPLASNCKTCKSCTLRGFSREINLHCTSRFAISHRIQNKKRKLISERRPLDRFKQDRSQNYANKKTLYEPKKSKESVKDRTKIQKLFSVVYSKRSIDSQDTEAIQHVYRSN